MNENKKILSVFLSLCVVFLSFTVLLLTTAVSRSADGVLTEDVILIGSTGGHQNIANIAIPLSFTEANGSICFALNGNSYEEAFYLYASGSMKILPVKIR